MAKLYTAFLVQAHMLLPQLSGQPLNNGVSIHLQQQEHNTRLDKITLSTVLFRCSSQTHDAGRQVYTTPPAWTLKGRIEVVEQFKSPGPVYDANRGYTYLEQVCLLKT